MNKKIFTIFFLIFQGCTSTVLPNKEKNLADFIPQEQKKVEINFDENQEFNFVNENFPKKCEWANLIRVVDGDTIYVNYENKNTKVRFIGIDTPEIFHPNKPVEEFGLEASKKTKELLKNKEKICLISDEIGDSYDKYDRKLSYIFTNDGTDINAELLKQGLARGYYYFPFEREDEFRFYEHIAKKSQKNIWK